MPLISISGPPASSARRGHKHGPSLDGKRRAVYEPVHESHHVKYHPVPKDHFQGKIFGRSEPRKFHDENGKKFLVRDVYREGGVPHQPRFRRGSAGGFHGEQHFMPQVSRESYGRFPSHPSGERPYRSEPHPGPLNSHPPGGPAYREPGYIPREFRPQYQRLRTAPVNPAVAAQLAADREARAKKKAKYMKWLMFFIS